MSNKKRILIADDDPDLRGMIFDLLDYEGYDVLAVEGGIDVMKEMKESPFDLVITDLRMKDMHGTWVVRNIRRFWEDVPVILITAHADDPILKDALACGAAGLIVKPFKNQELLDEVDKALKKARPYDSKIEVTHEQDNQE